MIGIILTGHGSFATGITSGLSLIAGLPKNYISVEFLPADSPESLKEKLLAGLAALGDCEGVLILTDLLGGTPFNVALQLKLENQQAIEVIGGANFPLVLEASMLRMMDLSLKELALQVVDSGKAQIVLYEQTDTDDEDEWDE